MMIEFEVVSEHYKQTEFINLDRVTGICFRKAFKPGTISGLSNSIIIDNEHFEITEKEYERLLAVLRSPGPARQTTPIEGVSKEAEVFQISAKRNMDNDLIDLTIFFRDEFEDKYFSVDVTKEVLEQGYLSMKRIIYR